MTEDAARPPRPGAAQDGPPPPPPTPADPAAPPPPHGTPFAGATGYVPPPSGSFTSRYGLVRPREGRYLAGVCAAIGRATNTDPVLWRVLLAVLGFFGGIGILVYVTVWLLTPGEGDSASPVESMLGRGRSSMSPVTVIVLSIVVAVGFGYVVTNSFRAILLGAVILIGGALLLNREPHRPAEGQVPPGTPPTAWPGTRSAGWPVPPAPAASGAERTGAANPAGWTGGRTGAAAPAGWADEHPAAASPWPQPVPAAPAAPTAGSDLPAWSTPQGTAGQPATIPGGRTGEPGHPTPAWSEAGWRGASTGESVPSPTVGVAPPPGGYRPPFAPRGPYAGAYPPVPPAPTGPVRAPKRPKERSALGAVTFSLIFLALGVVAVLDLLDVFPVGAAGYFAAALAVIGLGLLVGTWFGRARWLIALGLVTASALGIATVAESYDRVHGTDGNVTWAPVDYRDLATRYRNNFGDAVLDLRAVDFDKKDTQITMEVNFGQATVVVPPNVDVTTVAEVNAGDATVFGRHAGGLNRPRWETTDLGADGRGGGTLRLLVHVNAGDLEVTR